MIIPVRNKNFITLAPIVYSRLIFCNALFFSGAAVQISHPETEEGASEMVSGTNMSVQSKPWQNPTTGRSYTVIARKFNDKLTYISILVFILFTDTENICQKPPIDPTSGSTFTTKARNVPVSNPIRDDGHMQMDTRQPAMPPGS